jgi:hypothetical protein
MLHSLSWGGTIASAVYSVILTNRLVQTTPQYVPDAATSAGLSSSSVPALLTALSAGKNVTLY